ARAPATGAARGDAGQAQARAGEPAGDAGVGQAPARSTDLAWSLTPRSPTRSTRAAAPRPANHWRRAGDQRRMAPRAISARPSRVRRIQYSPGLTAAVPSTLTTCVPAPNCPT